MTEAIEPTEPRVHYVVHARIEKVTRYTKRNLAGVSQERDVEETLSVTAKAPTLVAAVNKATSIFAVEKEADADAQVHSAELAEALSLAETERQGGRGLPAARR